MKHREELEKELLELDTQLAHLLLFSDEPKFLNKDSKHQKVYSKFPLAYYDPTQEETTRRIRELRDKILDIKKELRMKLEVHFDVEVNNKTYPNNPDEVIEHFQDSFVNYRNISDKENVINGNFTKIHDLYNIRKAHSFGHRSIIDKSISLINGLSKNDKAKLGKKDEEDNEDEYVKEDSSSDVEDKNQKGNRKEQNEKEIADIESNLNLYEGENSNNRKKTSQNLRKANDKGNNESDFGEEKLKDEGNANAEVNNINDDDVMSGVNGIDEVLE